MAKINFKRVILGGLLTGVVFIIVEFILEGLVHLIFGVNESYIAMQTFDNITLSGARFHIVNLSNFFVFCILIIWVYAAIRPRFGAGPKTSLITSGIFLMVLVLLYVNFINMGIFPAKMAMLSIVFNLIELPSAVIAGASIYKEE